MPLRLGKKPARKGAVSFKFGDFFDPKELPKPPMAFGHYNRVEQFFMLGNDRYGNCVWAGAAHEHMVWSLTGGRPRTRFLTKNVLSDYSAVTGFNPDKPDTDQGTDMSQAASYRRKTGVISATGKRKTIDSYVALRIGNSEQLALAMWLTGAAGIGLQLTSNAMTQFDKGQTWSVVNKSQNEGGHYVSGVGRDRDGNFIVVTWGKTHRMSPEFYERYSDEAVAYISLEILNEKNLSPEGFDAETLRKHVAKLT